MRHLILAAGLACLGHSALAAGSQGVHQGRIDAIWDAINDRISRQEDVWFDDGDFPACIQLLKVQAELFPADYDIWTNLGWMQENVEQWGDALATYIRYRRGNPGDPDAALPEAFYYSRKRLFAKVPALLEPMIKHRCHPNNFRLLAQAYEKQNMLSDAARVLKAYIERSPQDGQAKVNLARVERKLASHT